MDAESQCVASMIAVEQTQYLIGGWEAFSTTLYQ